MPCLLKAQICSSYAARMVFVWINVWRRELVRKVQPSGPRNYFGIWEVVNLKKKKQSRGIDFACSNTINPTVCSSKINYVEARADVCKGVHYSVDP